MKFWTIIVSVLVLAGICTADVVRVDFQAQQINAVDSSGSWTPVASVTEAGFTTWQVGPNTSTNNTSYAKNFAEFGGFTVLTSEVDSRGTGQINPAGAGSHAYADLTEEMIKEGVVSLTFVGLQAGDYVIKTWHNDVYAQAGELMPRIDFYITDATRNHVLMYAGVQPSWVHDWSAPGFTMNNNPTSMMTVEIAFTSNGTDPVVWYTDSSMGSVTDPGWKESMVNGFELIPEPTTMALLGLGGLLTLRRKR